MRPRLRKIDGWHLRMALRAGIARVLAGTDLLNRINVFPVPDGDTGTNMAMTLITVDQALAALDSRDAGEVLAAAADAAIDGARGNSGAILAEFLQGLAEGAGERQRLNARELAGAFGSAERYARGALDHPLEGTILTAMSATAASFSAQAEARENDLRRILPATVAAARTAVESTRHTLQAMRQAQVEDAGAVGFLLLMEGVADAALGELAGAGPVTAPRARPAGDAASVVAAHAEDPGQHRFCTECVVAGPGIDRRKLRDELAALGTSLVIAGHRERVKIHIHAATPGTVFELAARFGTVSAQKADDMTRQVRSRGSAGQRTAVVTDSGADLPEDLLDAFGIHTVPLRIHFADRTFLDKVGMTSSEFLREIAASAHHPKTSQPAPGDLRRTYDFLASHHEHVIAISLLGRVSGTLQASRMAARRCASPERVTVVDSQSVSVGQGLVALHAAECARAGMSARQILESVHDVIATTRLYGAVTDLGYATRGGRLPRSAAWLAGALPVLPVLSVGGRVGVSGAFRRGASPVAPLLRSATRRLNPRRRYRFAIAQAGLPEAAAELGDAIRRRVPDAAEIHVTELGAAASVHGGPGSLAVAVQEYRDPEKLAPAD